MCADICSKKCLSIIDTFADSKVTDLDPPVWASPDDKDVLIPSISLRANRVKELLPLVSNLGVHIRAHAAGQGLPRFDW